MDMSDGMFSHATSHIFFIRQEPRHPLEYRNDKPIYSSLGRSILKDNILIFFFREKKA